MSHSRRESHKKRIATYELRAGSSRAFAWWKRYYKLKYRHGEDFVHYVYALPWHRPVPIKPGLRRRHQ